MKKVMSKRLILLLCGAISLESALWAQRTRGAARMNSDARIAYYERLLAADPGDIHSAMQLAAVFLQKTRETGDGSYVERASKLTDKALAADPKNYEALRTRNLVDMIRHEFPAVAVRARQMIALAPSDPQNWGTLGDALMEMGEYAEALKAFERMQSVKPGMHSAHRIGWHAFVTGDATKAIAALEEAVRTADGFPENKAWCLVELGGVQFKVGKLDEAERSFRSAIAVFPKMHSAYAGLGSVLAAREKLGEAIESYKKAQAMVPMVQYAGALADLYTLARNADEAAKQNALVDLAAKLEHAANQKANRTLGLIYADQERNLNEALEFVKADLAVRKDVFTWDAMAWVLYRSKQFEKAREASREALKTGTPDPVFYFHAGMIELALGNKTEGRKLFARALELNPRFDPRQAPAAQKELGNL